MNKLPAIWLFSENIDHYTELLAVGKTLGSITNAIALDNGRTSELSHLDIDTLYLLVEPAPNQCIENYAETIANAIGSTSSAKGGLLLSSTRSNKALAARLSIMLDVPLINDATCVSLEEGDLLVEQQIYGGLVVSVKKINTPFVIITLPSSGIFSSISEQVEGIVHQTLALDYVPSRYPLIFQAKYSKPGDDVELTAAKCVVGIGRGLADQDDLSLIRSLAHYLNAEVGCSRPIAEGEHWLGRERYIGISGAILKSDVYLALGISGQIQHMFGVKEVKTIIAINKDKNAPIFQFVDYGIVGDIYEVVPMLIDKLQV